MMRMALAIACTLVLVGCGRPGSAPPPPTPAGMQRVSEGKFVFAPPEGWSAMQEMKWRSQGFSAGLQKGDDPAVPFSYLLVQVKPQKKWPKEALQELAAKAAPLADTQDLIAYISAGKHRNKPELYSAKHDVFFFVQEYPDAGRQSTTVMAKRFLDRQYVVFHFYLRDKLETDVGVIGAVLGSVSFDEDHKNRTSP